MKPNRFAANLRWSFALPAALLALIAVVPSPGAAQAPPACRQGQIVTDLQSNRATIVGGQDDVCLIRYGDGQMQRWVPAKDLQIAITPAEPAVPAVPRTEPALNEAVSAGVKIIRPSATTSKLVYRADALGHVVLTAQVNGAPVRFLVDTGATLVSLSPQDAAAVGLKRDGLKFDHTVHTGGGLAKAAFSRVREIRIEQLDVANVEVAVIETLKQSVLGMSFLRRLKAFEMRDGELSMIW
jgi:clan AA aspartic protease (TIGR02281 family)